MTTLNSLIHRIKALFSTGRKSASRPVILNRSSISAIPVESFPDTNYGELTWRTLISSPKTPTNALTAGIGTCPPASGHLCAHRHTQAEIYYIISGSGIVQIDGVEQKVGNGSVVYIPGDAEHGIRNEDQNEELTWFYIFPTDGFENVKYRFSGSA